MKREKKFPALKKVKSAGFTLIESLVVLFLFAVVSMAFLETYATGTRLIIESKNRLGATALANQKMEIIRSIDYDTIGTKRWNGSSWVYGIPPGDLLEDEDISVNTRNYHVHTFVQYVDHPYDGSLGGNPTDAIPTDFKRVRLTVSWGNQTPAETVALISNVSPDGMETSSGGGVLSVNVLNASGAGVPGASVRIVNSAASIDVTAQTDASGNLMLPGAPAGSQNYSLTVSKSGYYGAVTYPPYPTTAYDPVDVHASVVADALNQKTVVIDQESDITLATQDPFGNNLPNISYRLIGGRILGTDPATGASVFAFDETGSTSSSGQASFPDESYGQYTLSVSDARYELYKVQPASAVNNLTDIVAGVNQEVDVLLLDSELASVKVTVVNQADGTAINGATVKLTSIPLSYDVTQTTDQFGLAYFPDALPELAAGSYDMEITAAGFQDETDSVTISGNLVTKEISLTAQ